jgi:hypothetical protein
LDIELLTEKLSLQVESFQESFEMLASASSIASMSVAFEKIIRGNFLTTNISIFHRLNKAAKWESLLDKTNLNFIKIINSQFPSGINVELFNENSEMFCITKLNDSSAFAVILGSKLGNEKYSSMDKITIQMFIQLFDNAYQSLLLRKNEKQLIFSLNNRVAQLNSLIDTGIEISKINIGDELVELVLSRAIILTNSSFGRIIKIKDGNVVDEIIFPPATVIDTSASNSILKYEIVNENIEFDFILELYNKESRQGIIEFDDTDNLLISAIGRQVETAFANRRFHQEALENEVMKSELAVASDIQKRILPDKLPEINGYDLA